MAKQAGPYYLTGSVDNLCFYKIEGKYYVRQKSSLTGKRVKKDAAFKNTMRYARLLGNASTIASKLYTMLPKASKGITVYRMLTGKVMKLLQEGKSEDEIRHLLGYEGQKKTAKPSAKQYKPLPATCAYADALIAAVFADIPTIEDSTIFQPEELPP